MKCFLDSSFVNAEVFLQFAAPKNPEPLREAQEAPNLQQMLKRYPNLLLEKRRSVCDTD